MKIFVWIAGIVAAVAIVTPTLAETNLIVDGDFSSPLQNGGWKIYSPGTDSWVTGSNDGIEIGNSSVYGLPCISSGCQNLEVNADFIDTDSQTVTGLIVGETYNLTWDYGGRPDGGPQLLDVYFGGTLVGTDTGSYGTWTFNWTGVTATGTSEILTFESVNMGGQPSYGNEITNVSLSAVPEPATWAMMLLGFAGLGFAGFRRAKNGRAAFVAA